MEIKTNSTRVIYNGETTTANAKYYIEYETDGKELKRVNASVNKVEEVEFPMEEGRRTCRKPRWAASIMRTVITRCRTSRRVRNCRSTYRMPSR